MPEIKGSLKFNHIVRNVENEESLIKNFKDGLRAIGSDTGDSEQKQDNGLYFYATQEGGQRHIDYLMGDDAREDERSDKTGKIEFDIPYKKISFPAYRLDIERNKVRAVFVEAPMFPYFNDLNSENARDMRNNIKFADGAVLKEICKEERPYVENKESKKDDKGMCMCFKVVNKEGEEEIRRCGVGDVEKMSVWLADNNPEFQEKYSSLLRSIISDSKKVNKMGLAFKYCGSENLEISKLSIITKTQENTYLEKNLINNTAVSARIAKLKDRMYQDDIKVPCKPAQDISKIDLSTLRIYQKKKKIAGL